MKRKTKVIGVFGGVLAGVFLILLASCENQGSRMFFSESKGYASDSLLSRILSNDIVFYGQVLDLEGNPVPNAKITYASLSAANYDSVWTGGGAPNKIMYADKNGRFEIHEVGGSLYVNCTHSEYYGNNDPEKGSQRKFGYGFRVGDEPARDPQNPATFHLRKKGDREPLYASSTRVAAKGQHWLPISEEGCAINLANGKAQGSPTSIYISYKADKDEKTQNREYDWRYTLRIPGGGLVEQQGRFDFIAPESGYAEKIEIVPLGKGKHWRKKIGHYFVKFSNGLYGIFEIDATASGEIRFRALVNPNPASRNLEYDYKKQINKELGEYVRLR